MFALVPFRFNIFAVDSREFLLLIFAPQPVKFARV